MLSCELRHGGWKAIDVSGCADYHCGVKLNGVAKLGVVAVMAVVGLMGAVEQAEADIVKRELYTDSKGQKVYGWVYEKGRTRFARSPQYSTYWGGGYFTSRVIVRKGHHHGSRGGRGGIGVRW
ncbi:MAG: hypothetical protein AAGD22_12355 [Verrucomicrobiota bacterium]